MSQPPYMFVPQPSSGTPTYGPQHPPFTTVQTVSSLSSTANNLASSSTGNGKAPNGFKAPAHKHAHHLHSIPPREKSTRTLIIDHMLWVHGRTRFAQARAELGMTDRTGGPSSPNYSHRQRPENYEEEDEVGSDGEDVDRLKARSGGPGHPHNDDEDERIRKQDLTLARSLRLRAEGLEKVVCSMLEQPPPVHPIHDEDILTPPTSPKLHSSNGNDSSHPHTLPNGVRLRLSLGTLINDLFARQAPPPPYRHQHHSTSTSPRATASSGATPADSGSISYNSSSTLPPALRSLATISSPKPVRPNSAGPGRGPSTSGYLGYTPPPVQHNPPIPSSRVRSLYLEGADPSTANSPPAFRCPRHLHTGCEICVEAKSPSRPGVGSGRSSSSSFPGFGGDMNRAGQTNGWKATGGVDQGGGITGWQDGSGIGSGLARPGVRGSVLRRKYPLDGEDMNDGAKSTGAGNTKLSELIPRFIRLSALVAMELGSEAREDEESGSSASKDTDGPETFSSPERGWENDNERQRMDGLSPLPGPSSLATVRAIAQAQNRMYAYALQPSREWYSLLAGLLTRAVLEGYLTAGWRGVSAVQCLLTVGLGINAASGMEKVAEGDDEDSLDPYEEFDPDELPSLTDATRMLFPSLRDGVQVRKSPAEEEFEVEIIQRMQRFYDIPASTPDLSTHMEDLAWQYPTEPVERAAARFCEAIAKWRGKPELETYKKKPSRRPQSSDTNETSGDPTMTIESLVHSNPTSPTTGNAVPPGGPIFGPPSTRKPSIENYFTQQPINRDGMWNRNKRMRSPDDGRSGSSKRVHG